MGGEDIPGTDGRVDLCPQNGSVPRHVSDIEPPPVRLDDRPARRNRVHDRVLIIGAVGGCDDIDAEFVTKPRRLVGFAGTDFLEPDDVGIEVPQGRENRGLTRGKFAVAPPQIPGGEADRVHVQPREVDVLVAEGFFGAAFASSAICFLVAAHEQMSQVARS